VRFAIDEKVEIGDVIEIKMLLPSYPPIGILTYGNVVRVNDAGNGQYEIALHFLDMEDEVRNEIIKYAVKRQRDIIRKQRL
jgi:c-di-GMP-binding flagellar brake protein YcgR